MRRSLTLYSRVSNYLELPARDRTDARSFRFDKGTCARPGCEKPVPKPGEYSFHVRWCSIACKRLRWNRKSKKAWRVLRRDMARARRFAEASR